MQPLLRIQSVPIAIEYISQRAQLKYNNEPASVNVTRQKGRANIQTNPAKIKIDSYEMRASMGMKTAQRLVQEYGQKSRAAGFEATANYAELGRAIVNSHGNGNPLADAAASKMISTTQTILSFIPSVKPDISVEGGTISFDYTMDKLTFDWDTHVRPQVEFVPGEIRFTVTQQPEVIIEYLGGPMYVPPSADPDYVPPPNMDASA